ncbi:lactonase family protein [Streptomyces caniscabiei]|uniref:lactonase family protein n=1 Tax=Streptomyces caniscabiei TaxID=2746961 RepID=UPI0023DBFEC3|nr:lactonase family protein [Streptomyces caniscabiei]MDX3514405.1 lactonase family protein [Streptomyces caniscabiei]MDX3719905.1 lactonase family protein [Streptomyces caniscabiei]WEO29030.1 lactonase family protein [Streptomyces caniscabiei]
MTAEVDAAGRGAVGGPRRRRAYIGSFTSAGGPGVLVADVDDRTGALTVLSGADDVPDPSYLALAPDGRTLYAVSERPEGAVAAYRVTGDRPELTGAPVAVGGGPTHLAVLAGHVLTADYGSGTVTAVPLRPDGALAASASGTLRHTASGPGLRDRREPHAHQVVPDPSGRRFLAVDLGADSVRVCAVRDGVPVAHHETTLRPGSGPRHLALHPGGPDGSYVYVLNELAPTVTVCHWKAPDGPLEPLGETSVLPEPPEGDAYPSGLAVSPDGRFVWTATRGTDVLSVLAVEGDGLRLVATVPCGGHWPRALTYAAGTLYVANERSGDVTWFTVDPRTGLPVRGGSIQVPAASCVVLAD